jgi:hypothetical protein
MTNSAISPLTRALLGSPDISVARRACIGATLNELRIARGQIQMFWRDFESDLPPTMLDEQILELLHNEIRRLRSNGTNLGI